MFREIAMALEPMAVNEAKGVEIRRSIGSDRLVLLDPFLLLDHLRVPYVPGVASVGFPRHPHRGIETLTLVFDGEVGHRDSLGNESTVGAGGAQWMTAGDGIFHEEKIVPGPSGNESLQLWFSLPRAEKRKAPAYLAAPASDVPEVSVGDAKVRVVAGSFGEAVGPLSGIAVRPRVLTVTLPANGRVELPSPPGDAAYAYLVQGGASVSGRSWPTPGLAVFTEGDGVVVEAGPDGASFAFVSARPLNEPVVQYRSFVMNTPDDIRETLDRLEAGTFA